MYDQSEEGEEEKRVNSPPEAGTAYQVTPQEKGSQDGVEKV